MLELLIYIFINAFWISLIGGTLTLFTMRLIAVLSGKLERNKALFVLFFPCSIGYLLTFSMESRFKTWYRILMILFFIITLVGSLFILYMHLELDFI
ncbi:MAG: hypothetical protein Q7I99_04295 [Acholeplasmataceae bacterium]|nr:hypothetical protein [Acholeplasmataceae bacterium]